MIIEKLVSIISQNECLVCSKPGEMVCTDCWQTEFVLRRPACFMCNALSTNGQTCQRCRRKSNLNGVITNFRMSGYMQELIYQLKYYGSRDTARFISQHISTNALPSTDIVTYVPATGKSQRRRGYNQAQILAKEVAKSINLPLQPTLLRLHHTDQIGLGRIQRFESVKDNFVSRGNLAGKNLLIVDDVITTGATINECARVLKTSGAKNIWGLVVAKK